MRGLREGAQGLGQDPLPAAGCTQLGRLYLLNMIRWRSPDCPVASPARPVNPPPPPL